MLPDDLRCLEPGQVPERCPQTEKQMPEWVLGPCPVDWPGLRERRPPGGRARLVPKQLQGESAEPGQVPTPRPTCAYRCPGLTPPACGPGPQPGEAVCPRHASALVPGPLLIRESALGQEGPPAALSAVSACEAGLGPRGAGSQPPLPPLWGLGPPHHSLELVWFSAKAV